MNDNDARNALIEQIKKSENILIALNSNPSIDELASALSLNLILNKTNTRATTIFSGKIPGVLGFLKPTEVFDYSIDSLRDFIIALDPEKADYVRTKVVDGKVRVSITPSKRAVTVDDLEFSQGDYNVDMIIALGVKNKDDFDAALKSHGQILHSAFVASICIGSTTSDLGNLNWHEPALQSYAQLVANLTLDLQPKPDENNPETQQVIIDGPVATALMTALVAVTDRFSNAFTTPDIMSLAAVLMSQGANQQLVATQFEASKREDLKHNLDSITSTITNPTLTQQTPPKASAPEKTPEPVVESQPEKPAPKPKPIMPEPEPIVEPAPELEPAPKPEQSQETEPALILEPVTPSEPNLNATTEEVSNPHVDSDRFTIDQPKPRSNPTGNADDSWDKVNKFKQAFLDKIKQNQEEVSQAKTNPESINDDSPETVTNQDNSENSVDKQLKSVKKAIKKNQKNIKPLDDYVREEDNISQRIAQELNPVQPPMAPPMPTANMPLPPPLPPMPPEFDQMTITNMPPIEQPLQDQSIDLPPMTPPVAPIPQNPPQPPVPPQPVPENQFVIPE